MTEAYKKCKLAVSALDEKLAEEISVLDISEVSSLADYFIIANGNNINQVQAIIDNVQEKLGKAGFLPRNVEGYHSGNWILIDYNDVIIHVFDKQNRLFYDLERIWRDGKKVDTKEFLD